MAVETRKVLGQSLPLSGVLTDAYTVPAATQAIVSSFTMCNEGAATKTRLSVAVAGAADALSQYLVYDAPLNANETQGFTLGVTLGPGDVVRAYSQGGSVAFSIFGVQLS